MVGDIRHGLRRLLQAKAWTAVVLLSLSVGIGANTALFSVLDALLLRGVPARDPASLVRLRWAGPNDAVTNHSEYGRTTETDGQATHAAFSYPMYQELVEANRTLSDLVACAPFGRVNVMVDGNADMARSFISSGNYYQVLGVRTTIGRPLEPSDDRAGAAAAAVISHQYWRARFGGNPSVVGKLIRVNNVPLTIVGVIAPEFTGIQEPGADPPDIAFPLALEAPLRGLLPPLESGGYSTTELADVRSSMKDATNWWLEVVGRLRPQVAAVQVASNLAPVFQQTARANLDQYLSSLPPAERGNSDSSTRTRVPQLLVEPAARGVYDADATRVRSATLLMGAVGLVLLIVCANVATLLLSRAATRQKEIAIRLSMGASRRRLIRQLLIESVLLSGAGSLLGLGVAYFVRGLLPETLGRPSPLDGLVLAFVAGAAALTAFAFGLAPALTATRVDMNTALKAEGRGVVGPRQRMSRPLLVGQVALALVLLIGAALFVRTTYNLRQVDVGFDPRNLLLVTIDPQVNHYTPARAFAFYDELLRQIRSAPGVRAAAFSQPALLAGSENIGGVFIQGRTYVRGQSSSDRMMRVVVSPGFFDALGIPITLGRAVTERDADGAPPVVVINEAAARRFFAGSSPIGQRFGSSFEDRSHFEIVGIARDARYDSLREAPPPTMYLPHRQTRTVRVTLEVRTAGEPTAAVASIRNAVRRLDPTLPLLNVSTQLEQIENRFQDERLFARAFALFGGLAAALAAIGLFGVMSYGVARRTGEIGIRMALGARGGTVLRLILRESMQLAFIGVALGSAAALVSGQLVRAYLFEVGSSDAASFAGAVLLMLAVAAVAAYLPARRASRVDPLVALRND